MRKVLPTTGRDRNPGLSSTEQRTLGSSASEVPKNNLRFQNSLQKFPRLRRGSLPVVVVSNCEKIAVRITKGK